jgi:hypothetical protein
MQEPPSDEIKDMTKDLMVDQINAQSEEIMALKLEVERLEKELKANQLSWYEWVFGKAAVAEPLKVELLSL